MNSAIIVAAGSGTRMGGVNKILLPLAGKPVLLHSLLTFQSCGGIGEIIIVARKSDFKAIREIADANRINKLSSITTGGVTRQQSVAAGVECAKADDGSFFIHDAARPLLSAVLLNELVERAEKLPAFTVGVRVKDTIKQADPSGEIVATPDRSGLWQVQTPQVFKKQTYIKALLKANEAGLDFTDDCQLMEYAGIAARIVEGSYSNIKITTPEDLILAETLFVYLCNGSKK